MMSENFVYFACVYGQHFFCLITDNDLLMNLLCLQTDRVYIPAETVLQEHVL